MKVEEGGKDEGESSGKSRRGREESSERQIDVAEVRRYASCLQHVSPSYLDENQSR